MTAHAAARQAAATHHTGDPTGHPTGQRQRAADAVIHGIGIAGAVVGVPLLVLLVMARGETLPTVAAVAYGASLVLTLALSGAYNLLAEGPKKEQLRPYDHAAIFLLIAGTYTPFALVAIGGALGYGLCAAVWVGALTGAALKLLHRRRYERIFIPLYLALGWVGVPVLIVGMPALSLPAFGFLLAGGLLYTAGVPFHLRESLPYSTAIWHGFVLMAAACHYLSVLETLAPL
ncbi:MAG: PAQR family membrane homeostasis protein TrhA [Gemmatimonas sp.]